MAGARHSDHFLNRISRINSTKDFRLVILPILLETGHFQKRSKNFGQTSTCRAEIRKSEKNDDLPILQIPGWEGFCWQCLFLNSSGISAFFLQHGNGKKSFGDGNGNLCSCCLTICSRQLEGEVKQKKKLI